MQQTNNASVPYLLESTKLELWPSLAKTKIQISLLSPSIELLVLLSILPLVLDVQCTHLLKIILYLSYHLLTIISLPPFLDTSFHAHQRLINSCEASLPNHFSSFSIFTISLLYNEVYICCLGFYSCFLSIDFSSNSALCSSRSVCVYIFAVLMIISLITIYSV